MTLPVVEAERERLDEVELPPFQQAIDAGVASVMSAHVVFAIFNNLARRAINAKYMNELEPYLKLAMRAQFQCRATWEALATIKNPPVMGYVRQANVAHRPQQVNNVSAAPNNVSRAGESQSEKQTIGGERWRTAGVRSGGRAKPS